MPTSRQMHNADAGGEPLAREQQVVRLVFHVLRAFLAQLFLKLPTTCGGCKQVGNYSLCINILPAVLPLALLPRLVPCLFSVLSVSSPPPHPPPHHHHPTLPPPTHAHRAMKKSPRFHQSRPASRSHHRIELALNPRRSMHPNGEDWSRLRRLSKGVRCLFPRTTVVVLYAFCTIPQIPKSCPCGRLVVGDGFP